jgi:hypothetical protein
MFPADLSAVVAIAFLQPAAKNGIFAAGDRRAKKRWRRYLRTETGNRRPPRARNGHKSGLRACELSTAGFGRLAHQGSNLGPAD